jgi:hypothetical protein
VGPPDLRQQIRIAAIGVIEEEFDTNLDLTMPWRFKLITPHGIGGNCFQFNITGPLYAGLDAWDEVTGIKISCWNTNEARVYVRLSTFNHTIEKHFEYANPEFPKNLADFVASELAIWVMQNELEQEEERYRERMIA